MCGLLQFRHIFGRWQMACLYAICIVLLSHSCKDLDYACLDDAAACLHVPVPGDAADLSLQSSTFQIWLGVSGFRFFGCNSTACCVLRVYNPGQVRHMAPSQLAMPSKYAACLSRMGVMAVAPAQAVVGHEGMDQEAACMPAP